MLRVMWRELETGSRTSLDGHEGGNPGYRQGLFYRVTAPALDPTTCEASGKSVAAYAAEHGFEAHAMYGALRSIQKCPKYFGYSISYSDEQRSYT